MIDFRYIYLSPLLRRRRFEYVQECFADDFVRALPDNQGRCVPICLNHGNAKQKTVMLAQVPALVRSLAAQSVHMGSVTVKAKAECGLGF